MNGNLVKSTSFQLCIISAKLAKNVILLTIVKRIVSSYDVHPVLTMKMLRPFQGCTFVTLAPGEECEGNAFGSVCLSVCPRAKLKTALLMDLIFTQEVVSQWLGPPLRRSESGLKNSFWIIHHCEIGQNMPSKVCHDDVKRALR